VNRAVSVKTENLHASYGRHEVLRGIDFNVSAGECLAVLGPNGVGKSTLFRCLLGFLAPDSGRVLIEGGDIRAMRRSDAAKVIAYIPQTSSPAFNYTVLDTVLMGAANRLPAFAGPNAEHTTKAMRILRSFGIGELADKGCGRISGGERQLALLARALMQDSRILLMDEPTANLDYGNRFRVMERVRALSERGYTVIFSTHEPNHALRYATTVLALKDGVVLAHGEPGAVLTQETLSSLYGIGVFVGDIEVDGKNYTVSAPYGKAESP
jgi:iron complex transport system ATP-binding protein